MLSRALLVKANENQCGTPKITHNMLEEYLSSI
jgi:hypothetical protein